MKRFVAFVMTFILAALLAAACGSKQAEPVSFTIGMTEYTFTPDTIEVKVGQEVTLELVNNGLLSHELMIGKNVKMVDNRPSGYDIDLFNTAGVEPEVSGGMVEEDDSGHAHTGFMLVLPAAGDKATLKFTATKDMVGEWEMGCFEQNGVHYTAGMKGKFSVVP